MEPLDPKAELMKLAGKLGAESLLIGIGAGNPLAAQQAETALSAAITLALAAERRRALEEAADLCVKRNAGAYAQAIRALIDEKTA